MKNNNKGYVLIEIILAFSIAFIMIYFMMDLIIKVKNKNDDLVASLIVQTEQSIITNKLMERLYRDVETNADMDEFCNNITIDSSSKTIKYKDQVINKIDDSIDIGNNFSCESDSGNLKIRIPLNVKQIQRDYDVLINYGNVKQAIIPFIPNINCKDENGNWRYPEDGEYDFVYTGWCEKFDDGNGDWRVKFYTDGDFTSSLDLIVDVFAVGGGGNGADGGGGGGGGYTKTVNAKTITAKTKYSITIGAATQASSGFGVTANGGGNGSANRDGATPGGSGGSGGGSSGADGGTDGSNGGNAMIGTAIYSYGGTGQGTTTREFGEETGDLYAGGGGGANGSGGAGGGGAGGAAFGAGVNGTVNTGGGGGGNGGQGKIGIGGSGIVVIRNAR